MATVEERFLAHKPGDPITEQDYADALMILKKLGEDLLKVGEDLLETRDERDHLRGVVKQFMRETRQYEEMPARGLRDRVGDFRQVIGHMCERTS